MYFEIETLQETEPLKHKGAAAVPRIQNFSDRRPLLVLGSVGILYSNSGSGLFGKIRVSNEIQTYHRRVSAKSIPVTVTTNHGNLNLTDSVIS